MKQLFYILLLFLGVISCKKEVPSEDPVLPADVVAYDTDEVAFVGYTSGERTFKKAPSFTEELLLTFKSRETPKEVFAWDQTYLGLGPDPYMEIELRLRYLRTEDFTKKTLAIYMPYWDDVSNLQNTIFETPIDTIGLANGFFQDLVTFHPTILFNDVEWMNVFEIKPLTSTPASEDGGENYSAIYYSKLDGIIAMKQNDGTEWLLFP